MTLTSVKGFDGGTETYLTREMDLPEWKRGINLVMIYKKIRVTQWRTWTTRLIVQI